MNSSQSADLQALLFVVIIVWRIARKLQERPVRTDGRRWRLPLILTVVGGFETFSLASGKHPLTFTGADVTYLVAVGAVSVVLGVVRGSTVRLSDRDGTLTQKYSMLTVGLWLGTIALRLGLDTVASHSLGVAAAVTGTSILMMFGLSLLGESAMVAWRAGLLGRGAGPNAGTGLGLGGGPRGPFDAAGSVRRPR
jgi:hypothetical protein